MEPLLRSRSTACLLVIITLCITFALPDMDNSVKSISMYMYMYIEQAGLATSDVRASFSMISTFLIGLMSQYLADDFVVASHNNHERLKTNRADMKP